jgi:REP element-mobilizing transposase RayT
MARGVDRRDIFVDDQDRRDFLRTVLEVKCETPFSILAYCLMGNHFHFAMKVENTALSRIMQRILTSYVRGFNARHDREGHLFQARYKSLLCLTDTYLIALIRYIHMNPVRAALISNPAAWPWSSYRQYTVRTTSPLADTDIFFNAIGKTGAASSQGFERRAQEADDNFKPWGDGDTESPPLLLRTDPTEPDPVEVLAGELFPNDLTELQSGSRRREISRKKIRVAETAIKMGHSLTSIAKWMNSTPQAIHNLLHRNK